MRKAMFAVLGMLALVICGDITHAARPAAAADFCAWTVTVVVQETDGSMRNVQTGSAADEDSAEALARATLELPVWTNLPPPSGRYGYALYPASAIRRITVYPPMSPRCM